MNLVMNVGFWAIKLAGTGGKRENYAGLVGTRRAREWCGEFEESSGLGGRRGDLCYFWRYNACGHEDHAERRSSWWKRVGGVKGVRNACPVLF